MEVYLHLNGLVERRRVEPLQIVEEHRERMLLAEAPENHLKAVLRISRQQVHDRSPAGELKRGTVG